MAILPDDLRTPKGPADAALFPGEDTAAIDARLSAYIANAEVEPRIVAAPGGSQDGLVTNYALYQWFRDAHLLMVAKPLTVNVTEKGGHGYSNEQIKALAATRDGYWSAFLGGLPVSTAPAPAPIHPGTRSVSTDVRWD